MKTTRDDDFGYLEEARAQASTREEQDHLLAMQERIYEMSKDSYIESERVKLVDALKVNNIPEITAIQNRIKQYASRPEFRKKIAKAIAKVSEKEAEIYYNE